MWCGRYVPATALATSGACASRWLPADWSALPAAPGDIETARTRWREEQERQAANRRPPRLPAAAWRLPADAPAPREPTLVRLDLAHQFPVFQAALPSSRGETYLRQRGGILRCRRVTARCGCARARSMRWRCWPLGWQPGSHLQRPGLAVGLGTARARAGVSARRGHHRAAAVTSSLPGRTVGESRLRAGGRSRACSGPRGEVRGSPCLSTSESPGLSGSPSL
jgi:hypothetical protein